MKISLITCFMLFFCMASAQLTVRNNAYVFVSDEILYVEDEVDLTESTTNLYLRNEAQLIQGNETSTNRGEGTLSVYQTGNVNQWSYNYWCSPVGNNSLAVGNEPARVNLIDEATNLVTAADPTGLISSADASFTPAFNGTASPLVISDRWLWTYQLSNAYIDWAYVGAAGNIAPGLGFTMKGNGTGLTGSQLYDFRGKPNNGEITNSVANGLNTLIGNPYPSAVDSAAFIHDPSNVASITGALLYWEQSGAVPSHVLQDYQGGYSSFTIDASGTILTNAPAQFFTYDEIDSPPQNVPPPNNFGNKQALRYIPVGQGFMVEGLAGTQTVPATVFMRNAHRVFEKESDGQSVFFRNSETSPNPTEVIQYQENGLPLVPSDFKRFRINVDFTADNAEYTRQLVLNFHDSATHEFDYGLEIIRSENSESDAYFFSDNKVFTAQAYPYQDALRIPLLVDIEVQQPLRFRIFDIQNFDETQGIYIYDAENDSYINLRNLDYELNIEPGNYANRFEIVFVPENLLSVDDVSFDNLTIKQNNTSQELNVFNPNGMAIKAITVFDITGKQLINAQYDAVLDQYTLSTTDLSDGVYVVNVLSGSNAAKSEKIIVKN